MCGPSGQEQQLANSQQQFSQTLQQAFNTQFANQSDILNSLNGVLKPIAEAGPNQQGFSPEELAAQNTQAINTTGQNFKNAEVFEGNQLAGRGGDSGLQSGVDSQIKASLASKAAGQLSAEQLGITQNNYATGRQNWQTALAGENQIAGQENPIPFASAGNAANQSAFGEANQVNQQNNQKWSDIAGGIADVGLGIATGGISFAGGPLAGVFGGGSGGSGGSSFPGMED